MKKKIALLLLVVGLVAQAKSFRSSSSSSRSFSRPSSSSRSSSSSFKSSSSSSSGVRSSSSSSSFKSSSSSSSSSRATPKITNVRPKTTTTTTNSTRSTNNTNTTIINNNTNVNNNNSRRGSGLDLMDVVILNSVLGNNKSTHTRETVYVERDSTAQQVGETQRAQANLEEQKLQEKIVKVRQEEKSNTFIDIMLMLLIVGVAACVILMLAALFL